MYLMKDITRDGAKVLRERAKPVTFPLSDEDKQLAHDMMAYLVIKTKSKTRNIICVRVLVWQRRKLVKVKQWPLSWFLVTTMKFSSKKF